MRKIESDPTTAQGSGKRFSNRFLWGGRRPTTDRRQPGRRGILTHGLPAVGGGDRTRGQRRHSRGPVADWRRPERRGWRFAKNVAALPNGAGGRVGSGRQVWSWISIDDLVGVILYALTSESLSGPVNAVAPQAVTNLEFTKTLGRVLKRPTIFPMPAFVARMALGQMANDLLLASARVVPQKLNQSGFQYRHPDLESALRDLLDGSK